MAAFAVDSSVISLSAAKPRTVPGLGLELMPIPAGTFTMGSPAAEAGRFDDEGPQTPVTISEPFWLGKTEVKRRGNGVWSRGTTRATSKSTTGGPWGGYFYALAFCRKVTERERAAGRLPDGHVYTLPTEAQWEYACRAGTSGPHAGDLDAMEWYGANSGNQTRPIAQKQANAWGLHDMNGNGWDWCSDWDADMLAGGCRCTRKEPHEE